MKIISVFNIKGGVGKTTVAVNLAYLASLETKTIIWDLDPQAAASFYLRSKIKKKGLNIKNLFRKKNDTSKYIKKTEYLNLDILPSDVRYRNIELVLNDMARARQRIAKATNDFKKFYELIFIDAPAGFSILSENIFDASDYIIIPMIPSTLSERTYKQLKKYFNEINLDERKLMPFFSMVDNRKNLHKTTIRKFLKSKDPFLRTVIPYASVIEKMGLIQAPVNDYADNTEAAQAYRNLWSEIKDRVYM